MHTLSYFEHGDIGILICKILMLVHRSIMGEATAYSVDFVMAIAILATLTISDWLILHIPAYLLLKTVSSLNIYWLSLKCDLHMVLCACLHTYCYVANLLVNDFRQLLTRTWLPKLWASFLSTKNLFSSHLAAKVASLYYWLCIVWRCFNGSQDINQEMDHHAEQSDSWWWCNTIWCQ